MTQGRIGGSLAFLEVKAENAGDHTGEPGDAHMSNTPVLIGP